MAEVVDEIPPDGRKGRGREAIYPWGDWFDGQAWCLTQGEDFTCKPSSMRIYAYKVARDRGRSVALRVRDDKLFIQASPPQKTR